VAPGIDDLFDLLRSHTTDPDDRLAIGLSCGSRNQLDSHSFGVWVTRCTKERTHEHEICTLGHSSTHLG
jgi:hypothetical protein